MAGQGEQGQVLVAVNQERHAYTIRQGDRETSPAPVGDRQRSGQDKVQIIRTDKNKTGPPDAPPG